MYVAAMCIIIVPSATPSNIQLVVKSPHSIVLSWNQPPLEQQNGQIFFYHMLITETQVFYSEDGAVFTTVGNDIEMIYNVTGFNAQLIDMLHPSYNYTVRVAAVTSVGIGPFSTPMTVTTFEDGMCFVLAMLMASYIRNNYACMYLCRVAKYYKQFLCTIA